MEVHQSLANYREGRQGRAQTNNLRRWGNVIEGPAALRHKRHTVDLLHQRAIHPIDDTPALIGGSAAHDPAPPRATIRHSCRPKPRKSSPTRLFCSTGRFILCSRPSSPSRAKGRRTFSSRPRTSRPARSSSIASTPPTRSMTSRSRCGRSSGNNRDTPVGWVKRTKSHYARFTVARPAICGSGLPHSVQTGLPPTGYAHAGHNPRVMRRLRRSANGAAKNSQRIAV